MRNTQMTPEWAVARLAELEKIYADGNPLAAHEALIHCESNSLPPPPWLSNFFRRMFINFYQQRVFGARGKGNSLLGPYKKVLKGFVRSRAYYTVRAWQKNPNAYIEMPRMLTIGWFKNEVKWSPGNMDDALRLAHVGLKGTFAQARMSTIRQARSLKFPESTTFGEFEAEILLGLRGPAGIFGPPDARVPPHVRKLLSRQG